MLLLLPEWQECSYFATRLLSSPRLKSRVSEHQATTQHRLPGAFHAYRVVGRTTQNDIVVRGERGRACVRACEHATVRACGRAAEEK